MFHFVVVVFIRFKIKMCRSFIINNLKKKLFLRKFLFFFFFFLPYPPSVFLYCNDHSILEECPNVTRLIFIISMKNNSEIDDRTILTFFLHENFDSCVIIQYDRYAKRTDLAIVRKNQFRSYDCTEIWALWPIYLHKVIQLAKK